MIEETSRMSPPQRTPPPRITAGKLIGQKPALKMKEVWAIRARLELKHRRRDLALSCASSAGADGAFRSAKRAMGWSSLHVILRAGSGAPSRPSGRLLPAPVAARRGGDRVPLAELGQAAVGGAEPGRQLVRRGEGSRTGQRIISASREKPMFGMA
jgi:hypothetical protein